MIESRLQPARRSGLMILVGTTSRALGRTHGRTSQSEAATITARSYGLYSLPLRDSIRNGLPLLGRLILRWVVVGCCSNATGRPGMRADTKHARPAMAETVPIEPCRNCGKPRRIDSQCDACGSTLRATAVTPPHVHIWPAWHRHCLGCGVTQTLSEHRPAIGGSVDV